MSALGVIVGNFAWAAPSPVAVDGAVDLRGRPARLHRLRRVNDGNGSKCARVSRAFVVAVVAIAAAGCARASSGTNAEPSPSPTLPIVTARFPAYGHAPDFSWIAGRLVRSLPAGQCTYVLFSTRPDEPWGGRIALSAPAELLAQYPDGDMVVVTGTLDSTTLGTCGHPAEVVRLLAEH